MELTFNIPEKWNDLNQYQLENIIHTVHVNKKLTRKILLNLLTFLFVDEDPFSGSDTVMKKLDDYGLLLRQVSTMQTLIPYLDFVKQSMTLTNFPEKFEITVDEELKVFYGPEPRLINLTIFEFSTIDKLFYRWVTKKDDADLDRLCVLLYREAGGNNIDDIREPFSMAKLNKRAKFIQTLDFKTKLTIGYAFMGSRELLISKFPTIFPKPKFKKQISNPPTTPKKYEGMTKMINSMIVGENLPLGPLKDVKETNIFDFFNVVTEVILLQRERNEKSKNK